MTEKIENTRYSEDDRNHDGLPDTLSLRITMPEGSNALYNGYQRCMLLVVFSYQLQERVLLSMSGKSTRVLKVQHAFKA